MKMRLALVTFVVAVLPSLATAMCTGHETNTSASACGEGQVWDSATQACVETTA